MLPIWLFLAALDGAALVMIGAAGGHGVIEDPALVRLFALAADYQAWHGVALLAIGLAGGRASGLPRRLLHATAAAFLVGTVLFSGSLYVHVLTGAVPIPVLTPLGGGIFIVGWFVLAAAGLSLMRRHDDR
jgi:uncharacterized membrane protein YgdD (TMEM256/DUF423 family)